ncbi:MAG: hypothetical protein ACE5FA_06150 [Dehalococcoidia bacterium]
MRWVPTTLDHLTRVARRPEHREDDVTQYIEDTTQIREVLRQQSRAWIDEHGEPLACVGIWPMWPGVGTVWTILSEAALEHGIQLSLGVRRFLREVDESESYWRLQATIEHGNVEARSWILWLGFVYEGTMRAYGPTGHTHDLYARVRH